MALTDATITTHTRPALLTDATALDPALLARPEAQAARRRGLLRAKAEALRSAERLVGWARPLLVGVLIVSFLHLWHQIARIAPEGVPALPLPAWTHWLSAALLTLSVDATALYLVAARSAAQYARLGEQGNAAVWFFYVLTAALNSLFVLSYAPGLPTAVQTITPLLSLVGALLLGLLVPISIAALERARQVADVARLSLLVEVETLRGLAQAQHQSFDFASQPPETQPGARLENLEESEPAQAAPRGVKPRSFILDDLLASLAAAAQPLSPAELRARLRCGETTVHHLLQEGMATGRVRRAERGRYTLPDADAQA